MSYKDRIAEDARFYILQELDKQIDGHLNQVSLRRVLDVYGIARDGNWIATQLRALEALDAIEVSEAGSILVAHILPAGRNHVHERAVIVGVTAPRDAS
jgi:hypothetical protein